MSSAKCNPPNIVMKVTKKYLPGASRATNGLNKDCIIHLNSIVDNLCSTLSHNRQARFLDSVCCHSATMTAKKKCVNQVSDSSIFLKIIL